MGTNDTDASIVIGGKLSSALVRPLLTLLCDIARVNPVRTKLNEFLLREGANKGRLFTCSEYARWGHFADLEAFCKGHNLYFSRTTSEGQEIEPETKVWDAENMTEHTIRLDTCGYAVIKASDVEEVLQDLEDTSHDPEDNILCAIDSLKELLPPEIEIPPFTVDGKPLEEV